MIISKENWTRSPFTIREKIHTEIIEKSADASKAIANEIAATIRKKASENKLCVLGLATGSSPISIYDELI